MNLGWKSVPALCTCSILCMTSGCAGMSGLVAKSDHQGGAVVYDKHGPYPRALARMDAQGNRYVLAQPPLELERGAGGVDAATETLASTAHAYCGPSDGEWWLAFTVVYLIVLLIEVIIAAIDDAD